MFGIDFLGGDSTIYSFAQRVSEGDVRAAVTPIGEKDAIIQYQRGANEERLSITTSVGSSARVETALKKKFPQADFVAVGHQQVGATLGKEILQSAVVASLMAMFGILVYVAFRYEFFFAVAAVIAVLHDVLFAIGAYCLASYFSGRQFNATVVAAILTIIGFSINDKIVIFDRIRENLRLGVRGSFKDVINQALNQTLSRTIITSGTVLIATGCLYWFGGGVIPRDSEFPGGAKRRFQHYLMGCAERPSRRIGASACCPTRNRYLGGDRGWTLPLRWLELQVASNRPGPKIPAERVHGSSCCARPISLGRH